MTGGVQQANAVSPLTFDPAGVRFGYVDFGQTKTLPVVMTNTGTTAINVVGITAPASPFGISGLAPLTLAPGQSTTFNVSFQPTVAGAVSGKTVITSSASTTPLTLMLYGTGVAGILAANPKAMNFGAVPVGSTKTVNQVVVNATSQVTISEVSVAGAGFSFSGIDVPTTLAAGQSYTFPISFSPQTAASATGSLTMVSSAQNSTLTISLSGGSGTTTGSGTKLSFAPPALRFGYAPVGSSKTMTGKLVASGGDIQVSSAVSSSLEFVLNGIAFP